MNLTSFVACLLPEPAQNGVMRLRRPLLCRHVPRSVY